MKKSIAGLGAVVVGFAGVIVGATPAQAAPVPAPTPDCTTTAGGSYVLTENAADRDYFAECIPQYGTFSKEDIDFVSETGFPDDFEMGSDDFTTAASEFDDAAAGAYLDNEYRGGFSSLDTDLISEDHKNLLATAAGAIKLSVEKLTDFTVSDVCDVDDAEYDAAYRYTWAPLSTTFTTKANLSIDGTPGTFLVETAPQGYTAFLNFAPNSGGGADVFDPEAPQCVDGEDFQFGANNQTGEWFDAQYAAQYPAPRVSFETSTFQTTATVPAISTSSLPNAVTGNAYSATIGVTAGPATSFSTVGSLPAGLALNATTGVISGTPTKVGSTSFSVKATNSVGSASKSLSIKVLADKLDPYVKVETTARHYGQASSATVWVKSDSKAASGSVTVTVDGKTIKKAALSKGKAVIALPKTLKPGKHDVAVTYAGNSFTKTEVKTATVKVKKGVSRASIVIKKSAVKGKTKLKAKVSVRVPGTSVVPTGAVEIRVNGKLLKTATLKKGVAYYTLPVFTKKGTAKVTATYLESELVWSDKSATYKVKVK